MYPSRHVLWWCVGVGTAFLTPLSLLRMGVGTLIDNEVLALGFDAERITLLRSLLLTALGSAFAGFLLQRLSAAWIGGVVYFVIYGP